MNQPVEPAARYRELTGLRRWLFFLATVAVIAITIINLWHINIAGRVMLEGAFLALLLGFSLTFIFIIAPATKYASRSRVPWYDFVLAFASLLCCLWLFVETAQIIELGWVVRPPLDILITGTILWLLVLEACRRAGGVVFAVVVLLFSVYPLFCQFMPGFLVGMGYSFPRVTGFHSLSDSSIFGLPMHVYGRLIIGFMIFAMMLQATGGGRFFLNIALSLLGHMRGGPAKVSVVASALFGSLSGSVIANVLTTGSVTIPTMKKSGYPAHYAAAVEACASTGGVLMPPIMGVTAFIMAEFLAIPYLTVCIAAAIPSILYYLGLFGQADFYAAKSGLKGLPREELPSLAQTLKEGWVYIFGVILLIYFLAYLRLEGWAPFYATVALLAGAMLRKEHRVRLRAIMTDFVEGTGKVLMELGVILAGVGMIIGSLTLVGTGLAFSGTLTALAGGNIFLLLLLGAVASGILGIGMTISACYIFLAIVLAPTLIKFGLDPLAVHLFIMYWGMVSFITPPVAIGAYAAGGLAGASPMKTGFQAMKLGAVIYFIPFFFVIEPALVLHGSVTQIILSIFTAGAGILLIAGGLEGYFPIVHRISPVVRSLLIISGILLAYPSPLTSLIGLGIAVVVILGLRVRKRSKPREVLIAEGDR